MAITSGLDFGKAVCRHFGLPENQVFADVRITSEIDQLLSVTIKIQLTSDDLVGIGRELAALHGGGGSKV